MLYIDERGALLAQALRDKLDSTVYSGPFKGMQLNLIGHAGNYSPFILGTYEQELHLVINSLVNKGYGNILNLGCSFGYYAAGLATLLPHSQIWAVDIDSIAMKACADTLKINNCKNVILSNDHFMRDEFKNQSIPNPDLIIMDIEGAEYDYLYPTKHDQLKQCDILVELHECNRPGLSQAIVDRFQDTHDIELIYNKPKYFELEDIFGSDYAFEHFDNAIVTFEGRAGPTPWAWMTCK